MTQLRIALAQLNPVMGDIAGNTALLLDAHAKAKAAGAGLIIASEMAVVGYQPEDLVLKTALQDHARAALQQLAKATADGPALLIGAPWREPDQAKPYNAVVLLAQGKIQGYRAKHELPNYGVFDDVRVFATGPVPGPLPLTLPDGTLVRLGAMVCEDMWFPDVAEALEESGAELLVVINGSPYELDKRDVRVHHASARVTETGLPLIYVNQVGGQDELVYDGASFALNADRKLIAALPAYREALHLTDWTRAVGGWRCTPSALTPPPEALADVYQALILGLRDYVRKNRFSGVVLGLSGGIDSALTAAIAVDALGAEAVHCVMLPSRYTSQHSLDDAKACAALLGVRYDTIGIEPGVEAVTAMLAEAFDGRAPDITEENVQSRLRGLTLMALSNKFGHMLLTTGNKSEMSVGYATLYGDMSGGYNVLKDVYKTQAFDLANWRNQHHLDGLRGPQGRLIPQRIIDKPPSAELRAEQKDEDSLPPYERLDAILHGLIERDRSARQLIEEGMAEDEVRKVSNLLDLAEYKRRQAPPGVKITAKAFGRDRRYPITNHFRKLGTEPVELPVTDGVLLKAPEAT